MSAADLALPAGRVARRLVRRHLAAALAARSRLDDPSDREALHDFRVALRRLRSVLRAYLRREVPKELRRRWRRLVRRTNAARDSEVQLTAWLARRPRGPEQAAALRLLRQRLRARRRDGLERAVVEIRDRLPGLQRALRATLEDVPSVRSSFATVTARLLERHAQETARALARIAGAHDREHLHAARIAGKRLRYLVEPLADAVPGAAEFVRELKSYQDRLGAVCDAFVRGDELLAAAEAQAVAQARSDIARRLGRKADRQQEVFPGLASLADNERKEIERDFGEIRTLYLASGARWLDPADALARALRKLGPAGPARRRLESRRERAAG